MRAKGKAPNVFTAPERVEPVADIPEGRWVETPASLAPVRAVLEQERIVWRYWY